MGETIQLSAALQVALFLASIALIVLVACLIPTAFQARRHLEQLVLTVQQLKAKLEVLVEDSRELVRNVNDLSKRANQQMDDVHQVLRTVHHWTERADRLVNEVGSAIEPPVFSAVRNMNLLRTGVTGFLQALLHRNQHHQTHNQPTEEKHHV